MADRRIPERRRRAAELLRQFGDAISFRIPAGDMAIWTKVEAGVNVEAWAQHGATTGIIFLTARSFAFDGRSRLSFALALVD
jgi:DNA-binding transcriptional MocR family regulator